MRDLILMLLSSGPVDATLGLSCGTKLSGTITKVKDDLATVKTKGLLSGKQTTLIATDHITFIRLEAR